jgi:hypothetical protein
MFPRHRRQRLSVLNRVRLLASSQQVTTHALILALIQVTRTRLTHQEQDGVHDELAALHVY